MNGTEGSRRGADPRPANRTDIAGQSNLTLDQLQVWVGQALVPGSSVYHVALALNILGEVEPAKFEQAFQTLINSCDALRTVIELSDGVPQQSVLPTLSYSLECLDVSHLPDPRGAAKTWMHERCQIPLDVTRRLFDSALIKAARDEYVWYLNCHHLIVDGASFALMYRRLDTLYTEALRGTLAARVDLPQFHDYVESERRYRASSRYRRVEAYWAERLSQRDEPLSFYRPTAVKRTTRARRVSCDLGAERTRKLRVLAEAEASGTAESALFGIFSSVLITYLHGLHGHRTYSVGVPIHNRRSPRLKETIGFFSEVLPIRVQVDRGETFASLRHKVRAQIVEVLRHGPFALPNRPQRNAYDVVLNYHPYGFARLHDMTAVPEWLHTGHGYESLTVQIQDFTFSGSIGLDFDFHCDVFNHDQCAQAVQHFLAVLDALLESPDTQLDRVCLLTPEEQHRILVAWNATGAEAPDRRGLHRLFEAQVERTPDAIAVSFEGRNVSYAELNRRANQLARHLRRCGVGPDTMVGVNLERSPDVVTSLLAVLKAGGAYLPLDAAYPNEWISFVLKETRTPLVLTQATRAPAFALTGTRPICLDSDWQDIASQSEDNLSDPTDPGLAYVIYTSGSTGRPKGVEVSHRGLVNFATWAAGAFELGPGDRVLQFASLSFDTAVEEIFPALVTGATLVLRTDTMLGSLVGFLHTCREWGITVLDLPTAYWHELTDALAAHALELASPLRLVIIGGEPAQPERLAQWHKRVRGRVRLVNTYGPTETTVVASMCELAPSASQETRTEVPIGRPIANVQTYVLDERWQPVPVGVSGELYIGGAGVARGYRARPDLSAERFVPDQFGAAPGGRLYRTGDRVRYRPDGHLEFLGRTDSQVKVRGFRIETEEIEVVLREHPAVRDVAVVCQEAGLGDKRLVAYVVAGAGHDWRGFLRERLPEYMLPAAFVALGALPRTANGKLERAALSPPEGSTAELEFTEPRSPLEEQVTAIWCDVLDVPRISIHANFFELGGHSLLATQVMSRLREALKVEVPLRTLFDAPTIAALAARIQVELNHHRAVETPAIASVDRDKDIPLSSSQRRMWFSHQLAPDAGAYNVAAPIRVTGVLDRDALIRSATELIRRHESLRTTFPIIDGVPVQVITPPEEVKTRDIDLRSLPEPDRLREAKRLLTEEAGQPFDVACGPLYRFLLVQLADEDHLLLMTLHHLISDAWSLGVIGREIAGLYNGTLEALPATPAPQRPVQYADFAVWHGQRIEGEALEAQLSYWKEQLAGVPMLELPADHPRPVVQTFHGAHVGLDLPVGLLEALTRLSVRERVTVFMTLLAAFKVFLHRYTGQADVAIGVPIANRHWRAIEDTIGTFVNTLVLRTDLSEHPTFRELLGRVREVALDAYANQDMPFERLVSELQPHRDPSRPPLVSVHFNLQNAPIREVNLHGLSWTPFEIDAWASQFDVSLTIDIAILKKMFFIYNSDLFERSTVERMLRHYRHLLEAVVAHPEARISDLPLLTDTERRQQLVDWNATAVPYSQDRCFHHLFEMQAARTPEAIAVACGPRRVTYRELNARANEIALRLLELGLQPETRVGICMERSIDMVAGLLGIMKAGGAYVPLDPDLPAPRIAFMLQDSAPVAVLTEERLARVLPEHGPRIVWIGGDEPRMSAPSDNPRSPVGPAHLAYVIYTSGSTGTPKGVEVAHRALVNLLASMQREPGLGADDVLLSVTPISFDIAALELYLPLMVGGRLVIATRDTGTDGRRLAEAIETSEATVMQATPATWRLLLQAGWEGSATLKVLCGGEALSADLADALLARSASLWNVYGPTETTIWSTVWKADRGPLSIGRPIANTQIYILDAGLEPVPPGVPGELYIGGEGLARGYFRHPELTAGKFVPDPFGEPGTRLFHTGDLAAYLPDGTIRFLGRIDNQVKIHGHRIELGEIEAVLARDPAVHHAIVIAREDVPGDKRLVAYLVLRPGRVVTMDELRLALLRELPAYMVPSAFMFVDRLPLTPSGKVDRRSLPAPDHSRAVSAGHLVAPRDQLELRLVGIWEKLLGRHGIGIRDDFFELGGHSLLAARLFVEIERSLGKYLPVATLFQAPTVEQLAQVIRQEGWSPAWTSLVELQRRGSRPPFFWVHGDASSLLLGRHLGPDQPLYGFDHQSADGKPAEHVTVEDIANRYLKELRAVQGEGPYVLGGYSFGAVVAFEMAHRLQDAGQKVALLLMLYPSVPNAGFWAPARRRWLWPNGGTVAEEVHRNLRELARLGPRRKLGQIARGVGARIGTRIQPHAIKACVGLGVRLPPSLRSRYILGIYFRALRQYVPRPYGGSALLFVETAFPAQEPYWLDLLTGDVEVHRLQAGHGEITTPPHLEAWAGPLRDRLQRTAADAAAVRGDCCSRGTTNNRR